MRAIRGQESVEVWGWIQNQNVKKHITIWDWISYLTDCDTLCRASETLSSSRAWRLPLFAEGHARGIQVRILHGLHLWAAQEIVQGVEGVWWPGHGLLMAGVAGRAQPGAHWAQALHVMHRSWHQVTWNRRTMKTNMTFSDHWLQ